jgi:hypothetical protein
LLKPANGLSGKATNSLVGDLVMQSLFLVVVLKKHKKKKKFFNQGHSVPFMLFVFILLLLLF